MIRDVNNFPVIPIHAISCDHLPGSIPCSCSTRNFWRQSDEIYTSWFRNYRVEAKRYIWLEWDSYLNVPLKDWLSEVWFAEASAPKIISENWIWFRESDQLGELRRFAQGMSVLNGVMLNHRTFLAISQMIRPPVYCELAVGTMVAASGVKAIGWPPEKEKLNSWQEGVKVQGRGLFHPIKRLLPNNPYTS